MPEQPMPIPNDTPAIQDLVIADMQERKRVGMERYNTLLQVFNGRDSLVDAYEEALDLATYLRQLIAERQIEQRRNVELRRRLLTRLDDARRDVEGDA